MIVDHSYTQETDPVISYMDLDKIYEYMNDFTLLVFENKKYHKVLIDKTEYAVKGSSCIWDPKLGDVIQIDISSKEQHTFYVSCGYYGFFKPSICEVFSQVPLEELKQKGFNAFYIDDKIEILRSGGYQKANAIFVKI